MVAEAWPLTQFYGAVALCGCAVLALLLSEYRDVQAGRWVAKPVASLAFVAAALFARTTVHCLSHGSYTICSVGSGFSSLIILALLLSFIGDVLLIPKSVAVFRAGIGAFALAHVVFIVAFLNRGINLQAALIAFVPLALIGFLIARSLIPRVEAGLKAPVIGYSVILTVMLSAAIGTYAKQHSTLLLSAAILFYLSDLTVAQDKFVREAFINRLFGLPMYYAAQLLFAATVALT